jgi:uncharacterized protein involved in outer membrane biogenesis
LSFLSFKFVRTRRGIVTLCAVLVLALFLVRPEVNRLRARIVNSISEALGRPVDVSWVTLRLLPQPGFGLRDFVVRDDPAFGAEPILRAQEVTATLRISSLLRGRLEIARLSLSEPSLNLVRNRDGHWNLEDLVERAAKIPVAPTSKARSESRPGFPYIEASDARINFKLGEEKKAFALTDADFSLWQDSENTWGVRLKAEPTRTDFNVTDTGTLRLEGSWERADSFPETPLQFSAQWERAQLGQFTRLLTGNDQGWRGGVLVSARLTGKPVDLAVSANASIEDFRRYDVMGGESLRLAAQCQGHYSSADWRLSDLACRAPVGTGMLSLDGSMTGLLTPRAFDLSVSAHDVPVQAVLALVRNSKKDFPDDLAATGKLNTNITLRDDVEKTPAVSWQGKGQIAGFHVLSNSTNTDLALERVPLTLTQGRDDPQPRLEIGPLHLALGGLAPANAAGQLSFSGYRLQVKGEGRVRYLLQMARALGLATAHPSADGSAKIDLQVAGAWAGFPVAVLSGRAQLSRVQAEVRGLTSPLEISTANVLLRPSDIAVQNITASLGGTTWRGSLQVARRCPGPGACPVEFDLRTKELAADKLMQIFSPKTTQRPWYRFLSARPGRSYLATLNATGKLGADRLLLRKLSFAQVSAQVEIHEGRFELNDLNGDVFGGKHAGSWKADFTVKPPQYSGKGSLQRVALGQIAQAMNDGWVTGTASGSYQVSASGADADDFFSSLNASLEVEARDASLPHLMLGTAPGPLRAQRFAGQMSFHGGKLEFREGKLETANGIYQVSGTASRGRILDLRLLRNGGRGFNVTGTLAEPRVSQAGTPQTRAALKPQ